MAGRRDDFCRGWGPGLATVEPITAACFLAAGAGCFALDGRVPHRCQRPRLACGRTRRVCNRPKYMTGFAPWLWDLLAPRGAPPGTGSLHFSMSTSDGGRVRLRWRCIGTASRSVAPLAGSLVGVIAAVALLGYAFGTGNSTPCRGSNRSRYRRRFACCSCPSAFCPARSRMAEDLAEVGTRHAGVGRPLARGRLHVGAGPVGRAWSSRATRFVQTVARLPIKLRYSSTVSWPRGAHCSKPLPRHRF